MDWTKAKTILIIALLLTDCILGVLYYQQYMRSNMTHELEIRDTVEFLENHHIYVDTEVPEKSRKMPVLTVKYEDTDEERVTGVLAEQEGGRHDACTEEELRALCDDILSRCGFTEKTLTYDSCKTERGGSYAEVKYKNIYDDIPLEKSGITCIVEEGQVVRLDRQWFNPVKYGKTKQKVIPAVDALIQFATDRVKKKGTDTGETLSGETDEEVLPEEMHDSVLPEEIHIEKIDMVYWLNPAVSTGGSVEDTALPAWRITYNGGEEMFIDAFGQR